jgi:diguanylate cyclase (GGDEF)-like protein/PAS domain S-box-containing protein
MDPWARRVAEDATHPVGLLDMHGRALYVNAAWRRRFADPNAYAGPAASTEQLLNLVHPQDRPRLAGLFECSGTGEAPSESRRVWVRIQMPNSAEADSWWTVGCAEVRDDHGRPLGRVANLAPGVPGTAVDDVWRARDVIARSESLAHVGAWDWDIGSGRLWWSDQVYRIFGLTPEEAGVVTFEVFLAAVHPDERDTLTALINDAVAHDARYDLRHRVVLPGGEIRFVRERAEVTRDGTGAPIRMLGTVADVTAETLAEFARDQAVEALAASENRYRLLAENASDVVWQVNANGVVDWVSESIFGVLGWSPEDVIDHRVVEFLHPEEVAQLPKTPVALTGRAIPDEFRLLRADGGWQWMSVSMQAAERPEGLVLVGSLRDVQAQVEVELELEHVMAHDPVTGLASRDAMVNRIASHLGARRQPGRGVAVMCISIDSLGTVNGAYSHAAGDRLLGAVAGRIAEVVGDPDLLGRGAGNEFFALVTNLRSDADARVVAERIRVAIHRPVTVLDGQAVTPTVSIGVATTEQVTDPEQLFQGAALAMQQAKLSGRNRCEFLDTDLAAEAQARLAVEADIREGLLHDQFTHWFQPIVSLADGAVVGHEALIRWVRTDDSIVEAWKFLPVAERGQLIAELDLVVLRKSIAELARGGPGTIAVNVSAASLRNGTYDASVARFIDEFGVDPSQLHLEVTETALLSINPEVQRTVDQIAQMGIAWFVDDFGTGYSSISHLRDLPISGLKLDKSFTAGIGAGDETCLRLADGLVGLAQGLGLETIAEGVETAEEAQVLRSQGWSSGQGWLYGRAAPQRVRIAQAVSQ